MFVYNPHTVSRVERLAFQLVGDKVAQKMKQHEELTAAERQSYWTSAVRNEMKRQGASLQ